MNFKKRGLGRGLEALLAEDSAKEETHQPAKDVSQSEIQAEIAEEAARQTAVMVALFKNIQKERLALQEEAEALRKLIEEFESIVRADLR
ncbi:MAG TPA: hypothetical protein VIF37_10215 [Methylobacter sp.]|jgi:predicted HTH domain antitoxin